MSLTMVKQFAPTAKANYPNAPLSISTMVGGGTTVTVTTTASHGFSTGDTIAIAGSSISAFNGNFIITVTGSTTFTFASTTSGTASAPSYITGVDRANSASVNITTLTCDGVTATAVCNSTAGFQGSTDQVLISGSNVSGLNGWFTITIINSTTFTFPCSATSAGASPAMTAQEMYYSNLGTIKIGQMAVLPGGPRLSGDTTANSYGWSSDFQMWGNSNGSWCHRYDLTSTANTGLNWTNAQRGLFSLSEFYYLDNLGAATQTLFGTDFSDSGDLFTIQTTNGTFHWYSNYVSTDTGIPIPLNVFFELRLSISCGNVGSGNSAWTVYCAYRIVGQNNWTIIYNNSFTLSYYGELPYGAKFGLDINNGTAIRGRCAMPTLLLMSSYASDYNALLSTLATPVLDPPRANAGYTWYWDPANYTGLASDANTGTDATHPLLSSGYIQQISTFSGFFNAPPSTAWQTAVAGVATGTPLDITQDVASVLVPLYQQQSAVLTGDILIINNNASAEIRLNESYLQISTNGITIESSGGITNPVNFTKFKILATTGWSKTAGQTYVYQIADTDTNACLWQNRRTLNVATSVANCNATQGSFYTDGTNMYVYPFGATNPATDGNCYERSQPGSGYADLLYTPCLHFVCRGITASGTTCNNVNGGYSFQNGAFYDSSFTIYDTCTANYWDKHGFGTTGSSNNSRFGYLNCISQGASAYGNYGGSTSYVDYIGTGSGNICGYVNCTTGTGNQVIGTNIFSNNNPSVSYTTHGAATAFSQITFDNCNFLNGGGAGSFNYPMTFNSCVLGSWGGLATVTTYNQCYLYGSPGGGVFNNCLIIVTQGTTPNNSPIYFNNCTIDYHLLGASQLFQNDQVGGTPVTITVNGCLLIPGTGVFLTAVLARDTFVSQYNEIQMPSSQIYVDSYLTFSNCTLAQLQSHSGDTGSGTVSSASVNGNYQRTAQSSIIHNQGSKADYTNVVWNGRKTAGAYEFVSASGGSASGGGSGANISPFWGD